MPEGDTIMWAANRIRPVLEGRVPDQIRTPHPRERGNDVRGQIGRGRAERGQQPFDATFDRRGQCG